MMRGVACSEVVAPISVRLVAALAVLVRAGREAARVPLPLAGEYRPARGAPLEPEPAQPLLHTGVACADGETVRCQGSSCRPSRDDDDDEGGSLQ
jgi:hypothetical protein